MIRGKQSDQGLKPLAIIGDPVGVQVVTPTGSPIIARGFNPWARRPGIARSFNCWSRSRPGLSLIEVMMSMVIFFMAVVAISRLIDMGTDRELEARLNNMGARLAQAKMAEVEAGITTLDSTTGQFLNSDSDWTWSMTATASSAPNLYMVSVTVSRDFKGKQFTVSIGQMIFDPTMKGAATAIPDRDPSGGTP